MTTTHCPECLTATAVPAHAREGRCLPCRPPRRRARRRAPADAERLADAYV